MQDHLGLLKRCQLMKVAQELKCDPLVERQQLPLYPKDPIRPMSAGALRAYCMPQESRLTPPAHRESKQGMIPGDFWPPLGWSSATDMPKWQTCSEVRGCLTRIRRQGRSRFVQAVIQGFQEVPHGLQGISVKVGSHLFPQQAFAAPLSPGRLEQRTTQLLHLIHQK